MDELPAKLFLSILGGLKLAVSRNVLVKRAQQNHGDGSGQEKNQHGGED
jgi:hypothetical protein